MSETNQGGNSNRSQNNNRQGGNRNNNRSNNNRGNSNNRSNNGGNRNNNRNRQSGNRNSQGGNRRPAPKPLTFWQKILAIFGIKPQPQVQARPPKKNNDAPKKNNDAAKRNTNTAEPAAKKARQPEKVEVTSGRLYVGNLSYETTEYDIEELFKGNGTVKSVEIIYNRHTHKSKGYGFVEMLKPADAKNAVDVHHDQPFMGRNLIVNGAKTRQPDDNKEESDSSEATRSEASSTDAA